MCVLSLLAVWDEYEKGSIQIQSWTKHVRTCAPPPSWTWMKCLSSSSWTASPWRVRLSAFTMHSAGWALCHKLECGFTGTGAVFSSRTLNWHSPCWSASPPPLGVGALHSEAPWGCCSVAGLHLAEAESSFSLALKRHIHSLHPPLHHCAQKVLGRVARRIKAFKLCTGWTHGHTPLSFCFKKCFVTLLWGSARAWIHLTNRTLRTDALGHRSHE